MDNSRIPGLAFALIMLSGALTPGVAEAHRGNQANKIGGVRPEVHGTLGWGFGFGGRLDIPIVPRGFLNSHQDELVISPGIDLFLYDFAHDDCYNVRGNLVCDDHGAGIVFSTLTVVQWNIYVGDWSFFPEAGFTVAIGDNYLHHHHRHDSSANHVHVNFDFVGGGGARWHFGRRNALVMRLIWPHGMQFGITF